LGRVLPRMMPILIIADSPCSGPGAPNVSLLGSSLGTTTRRPGM
jgi:hypothetical protein